MSFENFLRSIPLVHKHIMRTRTLMHENRQFRKFLERNGLNADEVVLSQNEVDGESLSEIGNILPQTDVDVALKSVSKSLREEQTRAKNLEASLSILHIDYNELLLRLETAPEAPSSPQSRKTKDK